MSEGTLFAFTDIDGDMIAAFTADIPDVGKGINIRTSEAGCSIPDEVAVKMTAAILRKVIGPVYESPEELAAEVVRLTQERDRLRTAWTSARRRAKEARENADMERFFAHEHGRELVKLRRLAKEDNDWHEAYNQLCSDLAYEMGMENPSIAGDYQVKARVAELVKESARSTGRCGSFGRPMLSPAGGPALSPPVCALPAGHAGWHRGDDAEWNDPEPAPRDTDLIQQVRALVKRYGAPVIAAEAARQAKHH